MSSRETILENLRKASNPRTHPEKWQKYREFPDLVEKFTRILHLAKGQVIFTENIEAALHQVESLLEEIEAKAVVINDEAPLNQLDLPARFHQYRWHVVDQTEGNLREFCAAADAGITSADAAFAETGSLVLTSGAGKSRFTSLLPPVHIALLPVSCLLSDIFLWERDMKKDLPGWVGFISGPSKTGDIEGVLTLGVHGPKRFIVILYRD